MVVSEHSFRDRNVEMLREGQNALNIAFGAILSAYIGNSLAEIDDHPFSHRVMARFFILTAVFILGLCLGNSMLLRGEIRLSIGMLAIGFIALLFAFEQGNILGFEVLILRLIAGSWFVALLASNIVLTIIHFLHHRNRK